MPDARDNLPCLAIYDRKTGSLKRAIALVPSTTLRGGMDLAEPYLPRDDELAYFWCPSPEPRPDPLSPDA